MRPLLFVPALTALLLGSLAHAGTGHDNQLERDFQRNQGGPFGNERSERPGRFDQGPLGYGGSGCPAGTMQVVFSPDNLSFTILFDQFVADTTAGSNGRRFDTMSCDARLPITLPTNQQMEITRVDYRGFSSLPAGAVGALHSTFNFLSNDPRENRDRIQLSYQFRGPTSDNYEISSGDMSGRAGQAELSPCGGQTVLQIHNDVAIRAPQGAAAQITLDSIDGHSNAVYYVNWKSCQRSLPQGPGRGGFGGGRNGGNGFIPPEQHGRGGSER